MRRKDREITEFEQIIGVIEKGEICRIAMNDEYPYIVPLNYGYQLENGTVILYFHSACEARKIELLRENPKIGFEIDLAHELTYDAPKGSCSMLYESVMGHGTVEFLEGNEKLDGLKCILKHYGRGDDFTFVPTLLDRTLVFKIECVDLTGKKH